MTVASPAAPPDVRVVGEFFDTKAARYDAAHDQPGPAGHSLWARMRTVLRLVGDGPGAVLDVGMGPGRLCEQLAQRGWTVSGIDPSDEMVTRARLRLPDAAGRLCQGYGEALPAVDAGFDTVVATGALEYTRDRAAAVAEIARVLRPGGLAVVTVPNPRCAYARWWRLAMNPALELATLLRLRERPTLPHGAAPIDPMAFECLLATAGLRVEAIAYTSYGIVLAPLDSLLPGLATCLARRLEGSGPRLGRLLATQIVLAARRDAEASRFSASTTVEPMSAPVVQPAGAR